MQQTKFKQTEIGEIPEDWKVNNLGSIAVFQNGRSSPDRDTQLDYPVYGANGIIGYTDQINANTGTVVIGRVGAYCGSLYYSQSPCWVTDNAIKGTPESNIDPKYLFYLLETLDLNSRSGGSGQPLINQEILNSINIAVPSYPEQQQIASFFSSLDDKIELSRRMNKTLEEMGKALFKRWFVDFEFPNDDGKPYKSRGGEMVDSELGEIPKVWEVKNLGDVLLEIQSGRRPRGGVGQYKTGIPSIGAENIDGLANYDYSKEKLIPENYFDKLSQGVLKHKDVLLYKDGAQIGRKTIYRNNFPHKACCVNEHVFILRVTDNLQNHLYFWLDQPTRTMEIINLNSNAAQPGINQDAVKSLKILIPGDRVLNSFDVFIEGLLNKIYENAKENLFLSQLRDSLLPRLMNGKLRVN